MPADVGRVVSMPAGTHPSGPAFSVILASRQSGFAEGFRDR
ncbi:unnamed protein product [[Actinomadura] parvosata subsp. kistnae]|nr:unnamed protein product [Actinomadura parvosata subsp. kistnae]